MGVKRSAGTSRDVPSCGARIFGAICAPCLLRRPAAAATATVTTVHVHTVAERCRKIDFTTFRRRRRTPRTGIARAAKNRHTVFTARAATLSCVRPCRAPPNSADQWQRGCFPEKSLRAQCRKARHGATSPPFRSAVSPSVVICLLARFPYAFRFRSRVETRNPVGLV